MTPRAIDRTPFFDYFLTLRHLLTRRLLALAGGGSLAILAPVLWFSLQGSTLEPTPRGPNASPRTSQARPLSVSTLAVGQAGPEYLRQSFTGIVKPRRSSLLAAKAVGRVERIFVEMGAPVAAGELLIQLDLATLEAERGTLTARLAAAQAQLAELRAGPRQQDIEQAAERVAEISSTLQLNEANLRRTESLVPTASISQQELDEARFTVDATQAKLSAARQALDLLREGTRVEQIAAAVATVRGLQSELEQNGVRLAEQSLYAPYAGTIQTRLVDEGVVVSPGQSLLQIVESGAVEIHVGLPPELAQSLQLTNLSVTTRERQIPVEIARLSPSINEATRTREVVLRMPASAVGDILLGHAVNVEVRTPTHSSLDLGSDSFWIPRDALTAASRGLWAVFIAVPVPAAEASLPTDVPESGPPVHRIERRQVELLRSQGEWTEIRGPLTAAERLVVTGGHRVTQGQLVVIDGS